MLFRVGVLPATLAEFCHRPTLNCVMTKRKKKKPIFEEASSEEFQQRSKRTNKNGLILSDLRLVKNEEKIRFSDGRNLPIFFSLAIVK